MDMTAASGGGTASSSSSSSSSPKVRLVRCPKCRLLLPEVADVPVYRCGGCNTVLVAKNRITTSNDARITPPSQEPGGEASQVSNGMVRESENIQVSSQRNGDITQNCNLGDCNSDDGSVSSAGEGNGVEDLYSSSAELANSQLDTDANITNLTDRNGAGFETQRDQLSLDKPVAPAQSNVMEEECISPDGESSSFKLKSTGETTSLGAPVSSPKEQIQQFQTSEHNRFSRVSSIDAADGVLIDSSELIGGRLEYFSKSATLRSSRRDAYDGSVSSIDGYGNGMDDNDPDQAPRGFLPEERLGRHNKFLMNGRSSSRFSENFSSELSDYKSYATKYATRGPKEQHSTDGALFRKGKRLATYDYLSSESEAPFYQRAGYESATSSSSQLLQDEQRERMKLLTMVKELQDALNKTVNLNGKSSGRPSVEASWKENQFPRYYDSEAAAEEVIRSGNLGRTRQSRFSRVPFSGGALSSDSSCLNCHPPDWQRSAQLPSSMSRGHYMNHNHIRSHNHNHPGYNFSSCPTSPQRNTDSDFHTRRSSDQTYRRDHELRKRLRDRHYSKKRHVRPTAGGAPFVTCSSCLNLLQLPVDFLLFKTTRRLHQLKCGACRKVLKFSLNDGTHIVPYDPTLLVPPPPSEVDPVSFSEDYGRCSTDMEKQPSTRRANSPLHRLMGYSTASEVFKRS